MPSSTTRPSSQHDRAVGQRDGREALGGDEHGAARERRPQPGDAASRSVCVSTAESGSSSTSDARAGEQRARERDALALAAGEVDAALADQRVVAVGQVVDERVDAGRLAGRQHLVPGRVRRGRR